MDFFFFFFFGCRSSMMRLVPLQGQPVVVAETVSIDR